MKKIKIIRKAASTKNVFKSFEDIFEEFRSKTNLKDEIYYNIMVAVTEGINNAAGHGNAYDEKLDVILDIEYDENVLVTRITDFGDGFDPDNVDDPRRPENLLKDSGRGVFIMKTLSKDFSVFRENNSNIVQMIFELKS